MLLGTGLAIETANSFTHFYPLISPNACKHKIKVVGGHQRDCGVFRNKLLNIRQRLLLTTFFYLWAYLYDIKLLAAHMLLGPGIIETRGRANRRTYN